MGKDRIFASSGVWFGFICNALSRVDISWGVYNLFGENRATDLEQAPKKLMDFFDKSLLQHFDFERFLIVRTIPFERKAL
jgi:hypothetical protein